MALTAAQQAAQDKQSAALANFSMADLTPANQQAVANTEQTVNNYFGNIPQKTTGDALNALYAKVTNDLNTGNFGAAFQDASTYNEGFHLDNQQTAGQANPLLTALETSQGLQSLDPSLQWTSKNINDYYNAAYANKGIIGGSIDPLSGQNTNGQWNGQEWSLGGNTAQQAAANIAAGGAPNLAQYLGQNQTKDDKTGLAGAQASNAINIAAIAALSAATGGALLPALGAVGTGAVVGGASGLASNYNAQQAPNSGLNALNLGSLAKSGLTGAVTGAAAAGLAQVAKPVTTGLTSAGINPTVAGGIVKTGSGAVTGALGAGLTGGNIGTGALSGAEHGAVSAASGAISNSIFGSGNTIFNSGDAAQQTNNPSLTNPASPTNMSSPDPFTYDFNPTEIGTPDTSQFDYGQPGSQNNFGFDPSTIGNIDTSQFGYNTNTDPNGGDPSQDPLNFQSGGSGASSAGGSALSGLLSKLFGSGGAGGSGGSANSGLLQALLSTGGGSSALSQLLGLGANAGAGVLNSQAAKSAANQYAGQTSYNPYSVNTNGGNASFNGTNATSGLSAGNQQTYNGLQGLTDQNTANLQAGPQAASQQYYNQLQASQADANNKMYQNNLDSQFGKGILSSTAGQYQSQAALNNISQQGLNDQVLANQFGQTQQQNQLQQLTSGLNGMNSINSNQNQLLQIGGNLGSQASNANLQAYKPQATANANSTFGGILSSIGNLANTQQIPPGTHP